MSGAPLGPGARPAADEPCGAPLLAAAADGPAQRGRRLLCAGLLNGPMLGLAGCAGRRSPPPLTGPIPDAAPADEVPAPVPPAPTRPDAAAAAALETERRWLQAWFRDTPVLIRLAAEGELQVDVPREFCFEPGRSEVKPALGAVLDRVAESLRRRPGMQLAVLAAPADGATGNGLALSRAAQVHKHLRERGVPARRIGAPSATAAKAVQLRVTSLRR